MKSYPRPLPIKKSRVYSVSFFISLMCVLHLLTLSSSIFSCNTSENFKKSEQSLEISVFVTLYKNVVVPKRILPYRHFPDRHIIMNYTVVDSRIPFPNCSLTYDMDGMKKGMRISKYSDCYLTCYNFINMRNTYYSLRSAFITSDEVYYYIDRFSGIHLYWNVNASYKHVLGVSAQASWTFGDLINGLLIRLVQIPAEIINISVLPISPDTNAEHIKEVLDIINGSNCRIVRCSKNDVVFAENLYTVMPTNRFVYTHLAFFGKIASLFGDICRKGFKTDVEPYEYVLYNRFPGLRRHFTNFDEILGVVKKLHPEHNYTTLIGHLDSIKSSVIRYSSIKWLFAVGGSNCMNCLFMGKKTGVLMFMSKYDHPAVSCCLAREIFLVAYTNTSCKQIGPPFPLPIHQFIPYLNKSLEILSQQHI